MTTIDRREGPMIGGAVYRIDLDPGQGSNSNVPRPSLAFVAWTFVAGRATEIASALGGEACVVYYPRLARRRLVPLRYAISSLVTVAYFIRRRPKAVVATLPPVFPGMLAFAYCRLLGVPFALDSHPAGFGRKQNRVSEVLLPIHRWLSKRAVATLVTTEDLVETVDAWGGRGLIVHEAPPSWSVSDAALGPPTPLRVLFVAVFSPDEPVEAVLEAARSIESVEITVTGDTRRAPDGLVASAPPNVSFSGFLGPEDYRDAVENAHVILALTTEPSSVMRAAYEAVYAGRPLVATDHAANRELFPNAVLVGNTPTAIAAGLTEARTRYADLASGTLAARRMQMDRWEEQMTQIRSALHGGQP